MNRDDTLQPSELLGGTIIEANDNLALAFIVEKDGRRYNVFVEGYDSDLYVTERPPEPQKPPAC